VPEPGNSERTAMNIVEEYLHGKELLECRFSMDHNVQKRKDLRRLVGEKILSVLKTGKSVGFITLGDPSIYSTYAYIRNIICDAGFEAETIPGIASFSAAAAVLNVSLCEGNEPLHILPATCAEEMEKWITLSGTRVIMKSGKNFDRILKTLQDCGLTEQSQLVSRYTMKDQKILRNLDEFDKMKQKSEPEYFSVLIVKEKKQ
jgi:precorrin-2/cobalt-factor-2 C20-methyltransferase